MDLVRTWRRQAARAVGVSLLAPGVLLMAAAVLAASTGGLGGLGALGQLTSGPDLPDTGVELAAANALEDADIVGANVSDPAALAGAVPGGVEGGGELAGASGAGASADVAPPAGGTPTPPSAGGPPAGVPEGGEGPEVPAAPPAGGSPADPVEGLTETVREIADQLPAPLAPTMDDILDVLAPPSP